MKKIYYNAGYFFLILAVFVFAGFYKPYFSLMPQFKKSTTFIVHFHAVVLSTWVILLIVQPLLIRYKKLRIHRLLGKFTYVLVPLIVCSWVGMVLRGIAEIPGKATWLDVFQAIYLPAMDGTLFLIFYISAVIRKKNIQLHSLYMIATGLIFINPSLARACYFLLKLPFPVGETVTVIFIDLIVIGLIFYLKSIKVNYKPLGKVLSLFLIYHIVTIGLLWHWFPGISL